jgi:hypothetical protein
MMKRLLASAGLVLASTYALAQPGAVARIAADGISAEFVFSNPGPQPYVCTIAEASIRYTGGVVRAATVRDVVLGPGAQNIVIKQPEVQIADLRSTFGDAIRAETTNGKVTLPPAGCEVDQPSQVFAVAIDNRSSCGDPRSIFKLYALDLKYRTIAVASAPIPQAASPGTVLAHGLGLPVFYGIPEKYPGQLYAWKVDTDTITALNGMALPTPPAAANIVGNADVALRLVSAVMLDRETLLLAYEPGWVSSPSGPVARLFLDVVTLDGDGGPARIERRWVDAAMIVNPELFMSRSLHSPGAVTLYLAGTEIARRQNMPSILAPAPTYSFGPPLAVFDAIPQAVRFDASKSGTQWQFTTRLPDGASYAADGAQFLTSGALRYPGAMTGLRIDNMLLMRAGNRGTQELQVWSMTAGNAPVLSQSTSPDLCDTRIIAIDNRSYARGEPGLDAQDAEGKTRLHLNVEKGDAAALASLLLKKPKLNVRDNQKNTPLMIAMNKNRGDLFAQLLAAGADFRMWAPDSSGALLDPLQVLLINACDACVEPLRKAGIPMNTITFPDGRTGTTKQMFCALRGQELADSARRGGSDVPLPPVMPGASVFDPMLEQAAQAARRAKIQALFNFDCKVP